MQELVLVQDQVVQLSLQVRAMEEDRNDSPIPPLPDTLGYRMPQQVGRDPGGRRPGGAAPPPRWRPCWCGRPWPGRWPRTTAGASRTGETLSWHRYLLQNLLAYPPKLPPKCPP